MTNIPDRHFTQLFRPLVGTPEAADRFQEDLSHAVLGEELDWHPPLSWSDPYDRLRDGLADAIHNIVDDGYEQEEASDVEDPRSLDEVIESERSWDEVLTNGIFGSKIIVAALRAVGDLYQRHAVVPQHQDNVGRSVEFALARVVGIAYRGGMAGRANLVAARLGIDPTDESNLPELTSSENKKVPITFEEAFDVVTDADGQIEITNRFPLRSADPGRRCGALAADRVVTAEDGHAVALRVFAGVIGDVVFRHIFPTQFDIAPSD